MGHPVLIYESCTKQQVLMVTRDNNFQVMVWVPLKYSTPRCMQLHLFKEEGGKPCELISSPFKGIFALEKQEQQDTPPNFKVCARRKVPTKRFKFCHILYVRNPKLLFPFFISCYFIFYLMKKRFAGTFRRAQTLKLGGVCSAAQ